MTLTLDHAVVERRQSRGDLILDSIYDEVLSRLNPSDDDCWNCGGEGYTYDCIDGCCVDAESGCEQCARRCIECAMFEASVNRAVRIEVLKFLDVGTAIAFAKKAGTWRDGMSEDYVLANLHAGRAGCDAFTADERADSACWVEGLLA